MLPELISGTLKKKKIVLTSDGGTTNFTIGSIYITIYISYSDTMGKFLYLWFWTTFPLQHCVESDNLEITGGVNTILTQTIRDTALWVEFAHIDACDLVSTSPLSHEWTSLRAEWRAVGWSGMERSGASGRMSEWFIPPMRRFERFWPIVHRFHTLW